MKKVLIIIGISLVLFFSYKFYLLKKYRVDFSEINEYEKLKNLSVDFVDIKHEKSNNLINLDTVKIPSVDFFDKYKVTEIRKLGGASRLVLLSDEVKIHNTDNIKETDYKPKEKSEKEKEEEKRHEKLVGIFSATVDANGDVDSSGIPSFKTTIKEQHHEINIDKIYKDNNINTENDLKYQALVHRNSKVNLLSSKKKIIEKYVFDLAYVISIPLCKRIVILNGDEYGYISIFEDKGILYLEKNNYSITFLFPEGAVTEEELIKIASSIEFDYNKIANENKKYGLV